MLTRLISAVTFPCSSIRCRKTPVRPLRPALTSLMTPMASEAAFSILLGMALLLLASMMGATYVPRFRFGTAPSGDRKEDAPLLKKRNVEPENTAVRVVWRALHVQV